MTLGATHQRTKPPLPLLAPIVLALCLFWPGEAGALVPAGPTLAEAAAAGAVGAASKRKKRGRRGRRAKKQREDEEAAEEDAAEEDTEPTDGEAAEAAAGEAGEDAGLAGIRRSNRMEFDGRLIQGETPQAGAVYLFERAPRRLPALLKLRQAYLARIVDPVLGKRSPRPETAFVPAVPPEPEKKEPKKKKKWRRRRSRRKSGKKR